MSTPSPIDAAALQRLRDWGGDRLLNQMVRLFLDNTPERLAQIEGGLAEGGDLEEAHRGAHSLKSSAANVGALTVSAVAARLEIATRERDRGDAQALRIQLEAAFREARTELAGLLPGEAS